MSHRAQSAWELVAGSFIVACGWIWSAAATPAKVLFIAIGVDFVLGCLSAAMLGVWCWSKFSRGIVRFVFYTGLFTISIALDLLAAKPLEIALSELINYIYLALVAYEMQSIISKGKPFGLPSINIKESLIDTINKKGGVKWEHIDTKQQK